MFPMPKNLVRSDGHYRFGFSSRLVLEDSPSEGERLAGEWFINVLQNDFSCHCDIGVAGEMDSLQDKLVFADVSRPGGFSNWLNQLDYPDDLGAEEFFIRVNQEGALVAGGSAWAVCYGSSALTQFLKKSEGRAAIQSVEARDRPDFEFRGVHIDLSQPGGDLGFGWRVMGEMMKLRMNSLALRINSALQYDSHPEFSDSKAVSKTEFQGFLDFARGYGLQVIPQVDLLSNEDVFTVPSDRDALREVTLEILELVQPEAFHLGSMAAADEGLVGDWLEFFASKDVRPILSASPEQFNTTEKTSSMAPFKNSVVCVDAADAAREDLDAIASSSVPFISVSGPAQTSIVTALRACENLSTAPLGHILRTATGVNELNFTRLGLLETLDASGKMFWDSKFEPRAGARSLSGMIMTED